MTDRRPNRTPAETTTSRRRLLCGLVTAGLVAGTAGCAASVGRGPDARVVWHETEPELEAVTTRETITVTGMVANLGDKGAVEIIAEARQSGREEPLDTHSLTLELKQDEQRDIRFEMEVSPAADFLDTRAEVA